MHLTFPWILLQLQQYAINKLMWVKNVQFNMLDIYVFILNTLLCICRNYNLKSMKLIAYKSFNDQE